MIKNLSTLLLVCMHCTFSYKTYQSNYIVGKYKLCYRAIWSGSGSEIAV